MKKSVIFFLGILCCMIAGCSYTGEMETYKEETIITPTETSTPIATSTPNPTPTLIPTTTPTPSPTPSPTPTPEPDEIPPVLTLIGETDIEIIARTEFVEPGYLAMDDRDGNLTEMVKVSGEVNVNRCGTYTLNYEVTDEAGNNTTMQRMVIVKQPEVVVPDGKIIYLTFDDGPGKYTEELLEVLEKYKIKATFFTCGNGRPDLVTKIHEAGHVVGIHCKSHEYEVVYASEEAYFEDLFYMQDLIYDCTGVRTTLVRFPGGSSNKVSSFNPGIMTRLTEELTMQGFQYFDWNVSSGDSGTQNTAKILENMKKGIQARNCSVVLQHPETRGFSMAAVEDLILWALEQGYTFLTLDATSPGAHHSINN